MWSRRSKLGDPKCGAHAEAKCGPTEHTQNQTKQQRIASSQQRDWEYRPQRPLDVCKEREQLLLMRASRDRSAQVLVRCENPEREATCERGRRVLGGGGVGFGSRVWQDGASMRRIAMFDSMFMA